MAAKSETRRVLELLTMDDLRDALDHYDLPRARSRDESVDRLMRELGTTLDSLVSNEGPFELRLWQDLVESDLGGWPRNSWAEIRAEIRFCLTNPDLVALRNEVGETTVSETRTNTKALQLAAEVFNVAPNRLAKALERFHGNSLILNVEDDLRRSFARSRGQPEPRRAEAQPNPSPQRKKAEPLETNQLIPRIPPTVVTQLPREGETIMNWTLEKMLGTGGFGAAYSAREIHAPSVRVVLKFGKDVSGRESLRNEYEKARPVVHPNVCRYLYFGSSEQYGPFLVMEHGGESLEQRYPEPVPWTSALRILNQAAAGVDFLHTLEMIHGDISTGNILVDEKEHVQISDFGISAHLRLVPRTDGHLTRVATAHRGMNDHFSAVEARAGRAAPASDQFSLALVLCALLQGIEHFDAGVTSFDALSSGQNAAIERALRRDHRARFSSCSEFLAALSHGSRYD